MIEQVLDEAYRRDPKHQRTWVALVDGNNHQIQRIKAGAKARKVKVTIVVDFVHVLEYLWNATWCFHAARDPAAEKWVHRQATAVLNGHARRVAGQIRRKATNAQLSPENRKIAEEAATYLTHKAVYLDYPTALKHGWPIATGIIEGACRHIVKDRMDLTGARWALAGAEAVLKLRAIKANRDLDAYWRYHLTQERHHIHEARYTTTSSPRRHDRSLQKSRTLWLPSACWLRRLQLTPACDHAGSAVAMLLEPAVVRFRSGGARVLLGMRSVQRIRGGQHQRVTKRVLGDRRHQLPTAPMHLHS